MEEDESFREAALRELMEETNQVAEAEFLGVMHWDLGNTQVIHQKGEVYGTLLLGTLTEDRPVIMQEGEVSDWRWVPDDAPLDFLNPLTRKLVEIVREAARSKCLPNS